MLASMHWLLGVESSGQLEVDSPVNDDRYCALARYTVMNDRYLHKRWVTRAIRSRTSFGSACREPLIISSDSIIKYLMVSLRMLA